MLTSFPVEQLNSIVSSKKRGKLSLLRGDEQTWFSVEVDSIENFVELILGINPSRQSSVSINDKTIEVTRSDEKRKKLIFSEGNLGRFLRSSPTQIDVLIDSKLIEIFINRGQVDLAFTPPYTNPYEDLKMNLDGKRYDAKAILYTLDSKK